MADLLKSLSFCNILAIIGLGMFILGLSLFIVHSVKIKQIAIQFDKPHTWVNLIFIGAGILLFLYSILWCDTAPDTGISTGDVPSNEKSDSLKQASPRTFNMIGYVFDIFGYPISNARIYTDDTLTDDITDSKGRFVLDDITENSDLILFAGKGRKRSLKVNINKETMSMLNGKYYCPDTLFINPIDSAVVFACSSDNALGPVCVPVNKTFSEGSLRYYRNDSTTGKHSVWIYILLYFPSHYPTREIHLKQSAYYNEQLQSPVIDRTVIARENLSIAYNELPVWGYARWQILLKTQNGKIVGSCDFKVVK